MQRAYESPTASLVISSYMSKVYLWMTMGIMFTGLVSWFMARDLDLMNALVTNKLLFYGLIIAQFGIVIWLSAAIHRMGMALSVGMFMVYAGLNGVTLSIFSLIYTAESIQSAFFTSATAFAGLSAFGYFTKRDLGPVGSFCTMGLFGLLGFGLLSLFFPSLMGTTTSKVYGLVGIVVFAGLTAYDTQKIKGMALQGINPIRGALKLYLDFINLFLFILRMQGKRR